MHSRNNDNKESRIKRFYKLMGLQEVNSNIQNSSAVPLIGNDENCMQDQLFQVTASETRADVYPQGEGKLDSTPVHLVGHDPSLSTLVLPCPSAHGILTSYLKSFFMDLYV